MAEMDSQSEQSGCIMGESTDTVEIPINIDGTIKWVTGLTRRTTCDDVIYALLLNVASQDTSLQGYAVFECWKGVERALSGRTKILKVWKTWGDQCKDVSFSVRKLPSVAEFSVEMAKSRRARLKRAKSQSSMDTLTTGKTEATVSHRKRHSTKSKGDRGRRSSKSSDKVTKSQAFHKLVKRILAQEHEIQDQLQRACDLDAQIDNYEKKVFLMQNQDGLQSPAEGADTTTDTSIISDDDLFPAIKANDLEAYMHICNTILDLQDKISSTHSRIMDLSLQVAEESQLCDWDIDQLTGKEQAELGALEGELDRSMSLCTAQKRQLSLVGSTLHDCDIEMHRKKEFETRLLSEIHNDVPNPTLDSKVYLPGTSNQDSERTVHTDKENPGWIMYPQPSYWRHNPYVDNLTASPPTVPPRQTDFCHQYASTEQLFRPPPPHPQTQYNYYHNQHHQPHPPHLPLQPSSSSSSSSAGRGTIEEDLFNLTLSTIHDSFRGSETLVGNHVYSRTQKHGSSGDHEDSDTGLSSLHSSDDSGTTMLETLV